MVMFDDDDDDDDDNNSNDDDNNDDGDWFEMNPPPSLMILISHRLMLRSSKTSTWENQIHKNKKQKRLYKGTKEHQNDRDNSESGLHEHCGI